MSSRSRARGRFPSPGRPALASRWTELLFGVLLFSWLILPAAGQEWPHYILRIEPPVPRATVHLDGQSVGKTDANGKIRIEGARPGSYAIRVERSGQLLGSGTVELLEAINFVRFEVRAPAPPPAFPVQRQEAEHEPGEVTPPPEIAAAEHEAPGEQGVSPGVYVLLSFGIAAMVAILIVAVRRLRPGARGASASTPFQTLSTGILPLDPELDDPVPDLGPEYRIAGLVNRGSQGSIYLAEATATNTRFAVKLPTLANGGDGALRSFLHEAEESRRLLNAQVITVFKAGVEPQPPRRPYFIMEYFAGISLRQYLRKFGSMSEEAALDMVMLRILDALSYAHRKEPPIIHRDLKPENVLVKCDPTGVILELKLIDFGLSFGRQGALQGTPPYVAPEVVSGYEPGPASDIFSLGVMLVELLQGKPPFYDEQIHQMKQKILQEPYDRAGIAPTLLPILDRMLEKESDARYGSAEELIIDSRETLFTLKGSVTH